MRNGLVQLGAWAAATGAAVALSWFGVHAVLTGAAFEQPTALPLPSPASADGARPTPTLTVTQQQSATRSESPAAPPTASASSPRPTAPVAPSPPATPAAPSAAAPSPHRPSPVTSTTSSVRSYLVPGGKVALDLKTDNASLISAAPDQGWKMQVWNGPQWIRVDFTKDNQANSVFVYWNGHPPVVDTVTR
ncbi:hypothetical protein PUR61_35345 [Streptomyces sp. BE20]|uniref:hypothetical protein n=1 Tax=Streptomycetaceae TaxID=2062 RepID=UPI002E779973|nr:MULTISPECIES: hypothetical protein [unclassified Streptomyces]MED7954774.1 hypothetical protein [Streptomyces sp. BE303]MEE1827424.1 hypothetical protein [Streptomyces sp. BE20]